MAGAQRGGSAARPRRRSGGRTCAGFAPGRGVVLRRQVVLSDAFAMRSPAVAQRILALTAAVWPNDRTGRLVLRSLTAYDH